MADIPTPRSYSNILADIIDAFLSKKGIKKMKVGGPLLSIFEAAAQSDTRSTQDLFNQLDAQIVDNSSGDALIDLAHDENLEPIPVSPSSGLVNFSDTSFTKKATTVYQGAAAPNIGSLTIKVADASKFPATGQIYIGRNTINYEGPLTYTSITNNTLVPYWTINLAIGSPTVKFHNLGEGVVLAQGGVRQIPSGTVVQTQQANVNDAVKFSTLYNAQILDGEIEVNNIEVIASTPGTIGNVPAGAIRQVSGAPYTGAAVTNPLPFTNGQAAESEASLRERIKAARQSRSKATDLAITSGVQGVTSTVDNKTVISASIVKNTGSYPTLYIDDGNGYEESLAGIAQETLMDSALGGEQIFQLSSPRPVAKAYATTTLTTPFNLNSGDILAVDVGGVRSEHTFSTSSFTSIANATAYEVVASINGDPTLLYSARTADQGTKVTIFAKSDTHEDIEVIIPSSGNNANVELGFPSGLNYTLRLYKNDNFLYKDGEAAAISSQIQSSWSTSITSGDTLLISVDNTSVQTITVTDSDFVNNNTGYTTVSSTNSLASWATVFNAKIAGVSVTASSGLLTFTSNLGPSSRAAVSISGGTLFLNKGMFNNTVNPLIVLGKNNDYTLDRNMGQLKLAEQLVEGDQLVAGSEFTRGYLQSGEFTSGNVTLSSTGTFWISADGAARLISTGVNSSTSLTLTSIATNRARYTGVANMFGSGSTAYIKAGDWVIIWDPAFTDKGVYRISSVDTTTWSWFEVERATVTAQVAAPSSNGIVFVRTTSSIQAISVPNGTYSMSALAASINGSLIGATASTFRNTKFRITTNTFKDGGDIICLTANIQALPLLLPVGIIDVNDKSHFASIEAGNLETGTPLWGWANVSAVASPNITITGGSFAAAFNTTNKWLKRLDTATNPRYGNNAGNSLKASFLTGLTGTLRSSSKLDEVLVNDRLYFTSGYNIGPYDILNVILDQDLTAKNFSIPMWREVKPGPGAVYGIAPFEVLDHDNNDLSLFSAFGTTTTFFNDFQAYMHARGKSNSINANGTILWRFSRIGREGEVATISYVNPTAPNQTFSITPVNNGISNINISLPSGNERINLGTNGLNNFVVTSNKTYTALSGAVARVANVVTVNLLLAGADPATVNNHTLSIGDVVYQTTTDGSLPKGPKIITAVSATGFSYAETGANTTSAGALLYETSKLPAGTKYTASSITSTGTAITATIGTHNYSAGGTVYFEPGHFDTTSTINIASGAKVLTSTTATTVTWAETTTAGTATLISGVPYTISTDFCQKVTVDYTRSQVKVGALSRASSIVTATISTTPIISSHPFQVGDIVYLTPGEANFSSGPKIITGVTGTTFTYAEAGANVASTSIEFFTSTSTDPNFTGGATPVLVGDIVNISSSSSLPDNIKGAAHEIRTVSSTTFSFLMSDASFLGDATPKKLGNTSYFSFYPITSTTAGAIVTWVNANTSLVTATLVPNNGGVSNNGSFVIAEATQEQYFRSINNSSQSATFSISQASWPLFDGSRYISATNIDNANSKISFKSAVTAELAANADFANEVIRLVPVTAQGMANFLGSPAISGLGSNAQVLTSSDGNNFEIISNTIGSAGAVQITGGTANSATAFVVGTGEVAGLARIRVPTEQLAGFTGLRSVKLQAASRANKITTIQSATSIAVSATATPDEWLIQLSGTGSSVVNVLYVNSGTGRTYQIDKYGEYMGYTDISASPANPTGVSEGDWVYIKSDSMNPANTGIYRIIRVDTATFTFWVRNLAGVEEVINTTANDFMKFLTYDSVMPGDTLKITSPILGSGNIGNFVISRLSETAASTDADRFYVTGSMVPITATALTTSYIFIQIQEATPISLYKLIRGIVDSGITGLSDVTFVTPPLINRINEATGSYMIALDKLEFSTDIISGLDAYSYNTGLLAEVNKVVYGEETNPSVYPGLIATGTNLNISGPLIKRIQVALSVRLRTGVSLRDVVERVKSSVASVINTAKVGESIAFSDIISAANSIDGVLSVTILSPTYNSSNDLIPVQINEKPRVLDITQDVLVSIVGS